MFGKAVLAISIVLLGPVQRAVSAEPVDVLHRFTHADGQELEAGLIQDSHGNLFGTAEFGGANHFGDVYELQSNGAGGYAFKVIYNFQGGYDGVSPSAPLVMDAAGNLYGTSIFGGDYSLGAVFELSQDHHGDWAISNTYDFLGDNDGGGPATALTLDGKGHIFGTTSLYGQFGSGTVFEITVRKKVWAETPIHQFAGGTDGALPNSALVFGPDGDLYGAAAEGGHPGGGHSGAGVVFRLHQHGSTWDEEVLRSFNRPELAYSPTGTIIFDSAGNIFGATSQPGGGAVYELSPPTDGGPKWALHILHRFSSKPKGQAPGGGLIFDAAGALYGVTSGGGKTGSSCQSGCGTAYTLSPQGSGAWKHTVLARFNAHSGEAPVGQLLIGQDGLFYGATMGEGKVAPTVYSLQP